MHKLAFNFLDFQALDAVSHSCLFVFSDASLLFSQIHQRFHKNPSRNYDLNVDVNCITSQKHIIAEIPIRHERGTSTHGTMIT